MSGILLSRKTGIPLLMGKYSGLWKNVNLADEKKGMTSERQTVGSVRHYLPLLTVRKQNELHIEMKGKKFNQRMGKDNQAEETPVIRQRKFVKVYYSLEYKDHRLAKRNGYWVNGYRVIYSQVKSMCLILGQHDYSNICCYIWATILSVFPGQGEERRRRKPSNSC